MYHLLKKEVSTLKSRKSRNLEGLKSSEDGIHPAHVCKTMVNQDFSVKWTWLSMVRLQKPQELSTPQETT